VLAVTNPECSDTLFDPNHIHGTEEVRFEKGNSGPVVFVSSEPCCRSIVALSRTASRRAQKAVRVMSRVVDNGCATLGTKI
jgi:hypothetical protein